MLRRLFTLRWLASGLLALAAFGTCLRLGWWQWTRFLAGDGDFQNLGYTALWPVFGVFALYLWWRLLADAVRPGPAAAHGPAVPERSARGGRGEPAVGSESAVGGDAPERAVRERRGRTRTPRVELPYDPEARVAERVADDDNDPELAAYNRYLASLNETPEARR